ncbi:MAG TPA: hypothetical protein VN772_07765 [Solirubrobacteraceae bacterium]|nr:hypothetical protein [Solirubrobacteraceae bacterium]
MAGGARRISVGFKGGQVLALRIGDAQLATLYDALARGGWHELDTEDGPVRLNVEQVVYVSAESDELHVGFG